MTAAKPDSVKYVTEFSPQSTKSIIVSMSPALIQYSGFADGGMLNRINTYSSVTVERKLPGSGTWEVIDNGPNDDMIGMCAAVLSRQTLGDFIAWMIGSDERLAPAARRYLVPVPDAMAPGEVMQVRVRVFGPAWMKPLPFDPFAETPESKALLKATAWTVFDLVTGPLVSAIFPADDIRDKTDALYADWAAFIAQTPGLIAKWEAGDAAGLLEDAAAFVAASSTLQQQINPEIADALGDVFGGISRAAGELALPIESTQVLIDLIDANSLDTFEAEIVAPRIDAIDPNRFDAKTGDLISIQGVGFDPYEPDNNRVYFTTLNDNGIEIRTLLAAIEDVPGEDLLRIRVPEGFVPGPLEVVVDRIYSNTMVFAKDFSPQITLQSPVDGWALAVGIHEIPVLISGIPDEFFEEGASVNLLVDGAVVGTVAASSANLLFTLDTRDLELGEHALAAELSWRDAVFSDETTISSILDLSRVNAAVIRASNIPVLRNGVKYYWTYNVIGGDYFHPGSVSGLTYSIYWKDPNETWYAMHEMDARITFSSDTREIVQFDGKSVEYGAPGNIFETRLAGNGIPLTKVEYRKYTYRLEGAEVCTHLTVREASAFELTALPCESNASIQIELSYPD